MSVDIVLKDIEFDGVNKIRVPLDGGGTQDFSIGGGSANLQTKSKTYTPTTSQQTDQITPDAGYDGMSEVDVTINAVPTATVSDSGLETLYIPSQQRKWRARGYIDFGTGGYVSGTQYTPYSYYNYIASGTTVTPTESQQTIGGADTILQDAVTVDAIPSNYVGSSITRRYDDDIVGIEDDPYYTVYVPAGYYPNSAQHDAPLGTEGTPTATKGAVSNHSVSVTPSVTNVKGYIVGGTHSGTAVSVSASELVSGTKSITQNGNNIDVTEYASVNVSVPGGSPTLQTKSKTYTPSTSQQTDTITPDNGYDGLDEVDITVDAMPSGSALPPSSISGTNAQISVQGQNVLQFAKSVPVTPVVTAGYISAGTEANTSVVLRAAVSTKGATTYTPTTTDQTIASGCYLTGTQTIEGIVCSNLTASNIKSGVTVKIGTATDDDSVTSVTGTYTGGASNFITGTFTTGSSAGNGTVTLSYSGSGYPVMCVVVIEGGAYNNTSTGNTTWYNSTQRYAIGQWTMTKSVMTSTPTYGTSGTQNQGVTTWIYKNSTSTATTYGRSSAMNTNVYSSNNASNSGANTIKFKSNTSLSYYVNTSSYGLFPSATYRYYIVYSS